MIRKPDNVSISRGLSVFDVVSAATLITLGHGTSFALRLPRSLHNPEGQESSAIAQLRVRPGV